MKLTFEKTRGTRTIYFPLRTSADYPSDFVVVIAPRVSMDVVAGLDEFRAGIAFCNPVDQFVKRKGRAIAFERLNSPHALEGEAHEIVVKIVERMVLINKRRCQTEFFSFTQNPIVPLYTPDMDEGQITLDLNQVMSYDALTKYFTKKGENRGEQNSQVA